MAGRMGNVRIKMINLQVVKILPEQNLFIIKECIKLTINELAHEIKKKKNSYLKISMRL